MDYHDFLASKQVKQQLAGFQPVFMAEQLRDFQKHLVDWAVNLGRAAIFSACGTGKGPMAMTWAENVIRHSGPKSKVLILAPLAVSKQFVSEGKKFGFKINRTQDGSTVPGLNVTNYHRLGNFRAEDFIGVVCDESNCIRNADSHTRKDVTAFLSKVPYRLLCTATPSPNDFMELGTSSEVLGNMTYPQMLAMFFVNDGETTQQWRLKGHAKKRFWQWVATWARAVQKPSDLGYPDDDFILPPLHVHKHVLPSPTTNGYGFFPKLAVTLDEQRAESKKTLKQRCEKVASLVPKDRPAIVWCHTIAEGNLLEKIIPDAIQVQGADKDDVKEERLIAFATGQARVLVSKPKIAGYGLNLQICSDVFYFPSHSHDFYFQAVRRCHRFGQKNPVNVHIVTTESEKLVLDNMLRKERQAVELYAGVVREMHNVLQPINNGKPDKTMIAPSFLFR